MGSRRRAADGEQQAEGSRWRAVDGEQQAEGSNSRRREAELQIVAGGELQIESSRRREAAADG